MKKKFKYGFIVWMAVSLNAVFSIGEARAQSYGTRGVKGNVDTCMNRAREYLSAKRMSITKDENGTIMFSGSRGISGIVYCEVCSASRTIAFYAVKGRGAQDYRIGLSLAIGGDIGAASQCPGKGCGGE